MAKWFSILVFCSLTTFASGRCDESLTVIYGDWVISDLRPVYTGHPAQIDNRDDFLNHHLLISKDRIEWKPEVASLDLDGKTCLQPVAVRLGTNSYNLKCNDGRLFGPPSVLTITAKNQATFTWFDADILSLTKLR